VTSIAADPQWTDRGRNRFAAYGRAFGFGELTAGAEVRREAPARILPRLKIADRCALDGRFLVVRGGLRTYRIRLGSANILMAPDDSYLCVVPSRGAGGAGDRVLPALRGRPARADPQQGPPARRRHPDHRSEHPHPDQGRRLTASAPSRT